MNKLFGYGLPFEKKYSSCSNIKPKTFEWVNGDWNRGDGIEVWIDHAALEGTKVGKLKTHKVLWLCESSEIINSIVLAVKENLDYFLSKYDYIFTCDRSLITNDRIIFTPNGSNLPWVDELQYGIREKTKLCSILASPKNYTTGHHIRHNIAEKYKDDIDVFGGVGGSNRVGITDLKTAWHDKAEALNDYMFSFTIENASYETYYTEKLTDCFVTGTVPIYWGSPDIEKHFNKDGIILYDEKFNINNLSRELYESKLDAINDNYERAVKIENADDILYKNIRNKVNNEPNSK